MTTTHRTASDIAATIDHTLLKPEANLTQIQKLCDEAIQYNFASVCVQGRFVRAAAKATGAKIPVCAVAGFPLGGMKREVLAIEATCAVKDGASEVDIVAHLPSVLACATDTMRADWLAVTTAVRSVLPSVTVKVILETAAIMANRTTEEAEASIQSACLAARESGCDFVKTSTGFHAAGGATLEAVALMKKHAGPLQIKASGGIRTLADAEAYLNAGASRLGCSAGVAIIQGLTSNENY